MAEVKNEKVTVDVNPEELKSVKEEAPKEEQKEAEAKTAEATTEKKAEEKQPAITVSETFKSKLKTFGKMALAAGIGAGATFAAIKLYGWKKGLSTGKHAVDAVADVAVTKAIEQAPNVVPAAAATVAEPAAQAVASTVADHATEAVVDAATSAVEATVAQ